MAANRAAASVNLTVAVATATLVAVGAILAAPAMLECSKVPGGMGACLRDRLDPTPTPVVPPAPPAEGGWVDARANEYAPPGSSPVELEGSPAALKVADLRTPRELPTSVDIAPPTELAVASPLRDAAATSVALIGPEGTLAAQGGPELPPIDAANVDLPISGDLKVAVASDPVPEQPSPIQLSAEPASVEPVPVAPVPVAPEPPAPVVPEAPTSSEQPTLVVEFNPTYPNVIVLPAPLTGDDSSFRSLQLN